MFCKTFLKCAEGHLRRYFYIYQIENPLDKYSAVSSSLTIARTNLSNGFQVDSSFSMLEFPSFLSALNKNQCQ